MTLSLEIDLRTCTRSFGIAPCTATGSPKCYETRGTCRDTTNFQGQVSTLKLRLDSGEPLASDERPYLLGIRHTSQRLNPEGLSDFGEKAEATILDAPTEVDLDDPYDRPPKGGWWSRLLARQPYIVGRPARIISYGTTTHWEVSSVSYPAEGRSRILLRAPVAHILETVIPSEEPKDTRLDVPETGQITAAMLPTGLTTGDYYRLDDEIIKITASGADRAEFGTPQSAHDAGTPTQPVLAYSSQRLTRTIRDLIIEAGGTDYVPLSQWQEEETAGLDAINVTDFVVPEPEKLQDLLAGLLPLGPLALVWDSENQHLRPISLSPWQDTVREVFPDEVINFIGGQRKLPSGGLRTDLQATRVYVRYGRLNPTDSDLQRTAVAADLDSEDAELWGRNYDREFESPLLRPSDAGLAERCSTTILRRYNLASHQPREVTFALPSADRQQVGDVVELCLPHILVGTDGEPVAIRAQITSAQEDYLAGRIDYRAITYVAGYVQATPIALSITARRTTTYDLFTEAGSPSEAVRVNLTVSAVVSGRPAIQSVGFHPDSLITITLSGAGGLYGDAGAGGTVSTSGFTTTDATAGGDAVDAGAANYSFAGTGNIYGGGGGGGWAWRETTMDEYRSDGGSGRSYLIPRGVPVNNFGILAGAGGDYGEAGADGSVAGTGPDPVVLDAAGAGGAAGKAINRRAGATIVIGTNISTEGATGI